MSSGKIVRCSSGNVEEGINDASFRMTVIELDRPFRRSPCCSARLARISDKFGPVVVERNGETSDTAVVPY